MVRRRSTVRFRNGAPARTVLFEKIRSRALRAVGTNGCVGLDSLDSPDGPVRKIAAGSAPQGLVPGRRPDLSNGDESAAVGRPYHGHVLADRAWGAGRSRIAPLRATAAGLERGRGSTRHGMSAPEPGTFSDTSSGTAANLRCLISWTSNTAQTSNLLGSNSGHTAWRRTAAGRPGTSSAMRVWTTRDALAAEPISGRLGGSDYGWCTV